MDAAWPASTGEAIHTSTFLGHPVGCAMALAQIREMGERGLPERSALLGRRLLESLSSLRAPVGLELNARGLGLLAGLEVRRRGSTPATDVVLNLISAMLRRGFLLLPEGEQSNVLSFSPPLTITEGQLDQTVGVLQSLLEQLSIPAGIALTGQAPRQ
jgi:4-aminobutyrate aminotransferase-like enzyme